MRAAGCKPFVGKTRRVFRQSHYILLFPGPGLGLGLDAVQSAAELIQLLVVAGLLLSSCSQQVQERADGGKTSDIIITEVPVEETCDSTGYRLYQKYLAAIGENPSYFQWKDFPKYLGAAYLTQIGIQRI